MKKLCLAGAVLAIAAGFTVPASADTAMKAGFLTCDVSSGWGFVFGSTRDVKCTYTQNNQTERYVGHIDKYGIDIGYVTGGLVLWAVVAPTTNLGKGALAGSYTGLTGGAAVGVGGNANVLMGGSEKSVSLQPVSIEGTAGLNVAAGVAQIVLESAE